MPERSRVAKDRRELSRLVALLGCEFVFGQSTYAATVVNLSIKGALLSAKVLPPEGSPVQVRLRFPKLKSPLVLDATVVRGGWGMSDIGKVGRFGVQFTSSPLDLTTLFRSLL